MRELLLAILLVNVVTACAVAGKRPEWLEGEAKQYPRSRYIVATGSADNPSDAQTRALGNLSKIFEVKVEETSRDESSAMRRTSGEQVETGTHQLTARYIDAYSTKLLEGASVVENWFDKQQNRHYALAVISRSQLGTRLRADIAKVDRQIQTQLARGERTADLLRKAQFVYGARTTMKTREMLQKDLQIVDRTGVGVPTNWSVERLDQLIDATLSRVSIDQTVQEDPFGELGQSLQSAISAAGMQYNDQAANYTLRGKLDVQDVGWQEGWYWYRGALQVTVIKKTSGEVMASAECPLKSSAQSQQQSLIRLKSEIADWLNTQFRSAILAFGDLDQSAGG